MYIHFTFLLLHFFICVWFHLKYTRTFFHLYILHFTFLLSHFTLTFTYANNPEERERYHSWYSWSGSPTGSDFNNPHLLAPKYSDPLHSKCSAPLYSWSGSLTGSDYFSLYISLCFRLNKLLTNLTSLRQHHLQYTQYNNTQHEGTLYQVMLYWVALCWMSQIRPIC